MDITPEELVDEDEADLWHGKKEGVKMIFTVISFNLYQLYTLKKAGCDLAERELSIKTGKDGIKSGLKARNGK